ncbi:MAG: hypothetical protein PHP08_04290 [Candidatus Dojkabacteria bacterium]|nr:hypothetical protein [Candidatus Dojkabacteria bacterium]
MSKTVVKQITFPVELLNFLEPKAKEYGYTLPGYVRYVLTKDMEKECEKQRIEALEKDLSRGIEKSIKESEEGETISLKTDKDIDNFLGALYEE